MSTADVLRNGLEWSREYMDFVLAKLSADGYLNKTALTWQPAKDANPAGWLLVHIVACEDALVSQGILSKLRRYPFLTARFCMDAEPSREIPAFDEIRSMLDDSRKSTLHTLASMTEEDFARVPAGLAALCDDVVYLRPMNTWTAEQVFRHLASHEYGHVAQIAYLHNQVRLKFKATLPKGPDGKPRKKKTTIILPGDVPPDMGGPEDKATSRA
jgi:hypothetical protein